MNILGIDLIALGVLNMEAGQRFCRDYGLTEVETNAGGATFHAKDGSGLVPRRADDKAPRMTVAPAPNLRETIWGVADKATLEAIGASLSADRQVSRDDAGVLRTVDDEGYPIGFRVTERHAFEARLSPVNVPAEFFYLLRSPSVAGPVAFEGGRLESGARQEAGGNLVPQLAKSPCLLSLLTEDVVVIEAIQKLHDRLGPERRPEIRQRPEAGSLRAPQVVAEMIERERSHVAAE